MCVTTRIIAKLVKCAKISQNFKNLSVLIPLQTEVCYNTCKHNHHEDLVLIPLQTEVCYNSAPGQVYRYHVLIPLQTEVCYNLRKGCYYKTPGFNTPTNRSMLQSTYFL